jgi:hypothetical protein
MQDWRTHQVDQLLEDVFAHTLAILNNLVLALLEICDSSARKALAASARQSRRQQARSKWNLHRPLQNPLKP